MLASATRLIRLFSMSTDVSVYHDMRKKKQYKVQCGKEGSQRTVLKVIREI